MINFNGVPELETPEFLMEHLDEWGGRDSYPTTRSAGRTPWTPPTSGPSRSPPTGAAPATAPSSTGRTASRPKARCARSSTTSSTWRRPSSKRRASRSRPSSRASCSRRWKASACSTASTTASAKDRHTIQYFEMFGNRGIYYDGWTAVTRHSIPWELVGGVDPLQRRRLGAVRHQHRLDPGARPGRGDAGEAGRAAAAVPDRSDPLPGAAAGRPPLPSG